MRFVVPKPVLSSGGVALQMNLEEQVGHKYGSVMGVVACYSKAKHLK